ncbi:hypothetical protein [Streptomyces sp. NRRL F-525]|uniref:hypothetical protein n=1 Tax=Streptomyces sp. NRRL F-525 TaxID=1463861 RepID=UPI000AB4F6E8|nr:hypothetical protein [Streptomyces sp. NRRL F-525]
MKYEFTERLHGLPDAALQAWPVRGLAHHPGGFEGSFRKPNKVWVLGDELDPEKSLLRDHATVVRLRLRTGKFRAVPRFQPSMERFVLRTAICDDGFGEAAVGSQALFPG